MSRLRTLLLIPSVAKLNVTDAVAANSHPLMDYYALQERLEADLADYAVVAADRHPLVQAARLAGPDVGLAMHAFVRANAYDAIFSNGENVSIPLAMLFKTRRRRPAHVLIGHRISAPKKRLLLRGLQSEMDVMLLYAEAQKEYAVGELGLPEHKIQRIAFHADTRFFHPRPETPVQPRRISSAGLELRDYPTLIAAVRGLDIDVRLAAASPWSKRKNETENRDLPPNVTARSYPYAELRDLYASSQLVVVPLYETDFQAGVTTILEAMAMGKAVIASKTRGQQDVIQDGVNGIYVPPGDVGALRRAITELLDSPGRAAALGANARRTLESDMSLELWTGRVAAAVRQAAERRAPG